VMQTGTARGMQTLEQALAELVLKGTVDEEMALSRSSRPEQLQGLIKRAVTVAPAAAAAGGGLRVAEN
jgi:twitching motility protein PilT